MTVATDEDGFTLIELLLSVTITIVILSSISGALIVFLSNGEYTSRRDDHSTGSITASSYLDRDLASAETISFPATPTRCTSATTVLTLQWQEYTATQSDPQPRQTGTAYVVRYQVETDSMSRAGQPPCQFVRLASSGSDYASQGTAVKSVLIPQVPAAALTVSTTGTRCQRGTDVLVTLSQYRTDTFSPYQHVGCLKARVQ